MKIKVGMNKILKVMIPSFDIKIISFITYDC